MNIDDVRAEMELDLNNRWVEVRALANLIQSIDDEERADMFRKAAIVMLYAHFEGCVKNVFQIFIDAFNKERVLRGDVSDHICAASLAEIFHEYEFGGKKCALFQRGLPDDARLHKYARQIELVRYLQDIMAEVAELPGDYLSDTESNLRPLILRKMLFRLGLQYDMFESVEGDINRLLRIRNDIAHGVLVEGVQQDEYDELERITLDILTEIIVSLTRSLLQKDYLRAS